jgi:hypothetical protein
MDRQQIIQIHGLVRPIEPSNAYVNHTRAQGATIIARNGNPARQFGEAVSRNRK